MGTGTEASAESRRRARTRERLLEAAVGLFAERGFEGSSVEDIARAAGFTKGAVYSNFRTKEELFLAVFEAQTDQLLTTLREAVETVDPGQLEKRDDGLLATVFARLFPKARQWYLVNIEFQLFAIRRQGFSAAYAAMRRRFRSRMAEVLEQALARADCRPVMPSEQLVEIIVPVYLNSLAVTEPGRDAEGNPPADAHAPQELIGLLLDALSRPAGETVAELPRVGR